MRQRCGHPMMAYDASPRPFPSLRPRPTPPRAWPPIVSEWEGGDWLDRCRSLGLQRTKK